MANFYVTNSLYPENPQLFTVNISKIAKKGGEENPNFKPLYKSAEEYWTLVIYTTGTDTNGDTVGPVFADVLGSLETVKELVDDKVSELCGLIDWTNQGEFSALEDDNGPIIVEQSPSSGETGVSISSSIYLRLQDKLPAKGIDINTLSMKVNGISVNPDVKGNKFDYKIFYSPRPVYDS